MKCKSIEKKLVYYLEGGLSDAERQFFSHHIELCTDCAAKAEYLKSSFQWLETEKKTEVKPFLYTRIKARMATDNRKVYQWAFAPLAFASVLVVGLIVGTLVAQVTIQPTTVQSQELTVAQLFDDTQIETMELSLLEN
jgi:anti-sigma factor RsiW